MGCTIEKIEQTDSIDELSPRQLKILTEIFKNKGKISVAQIAESLGVSPRTVYYDKARIDKNWLEQTRADLRGYAGLVKANVVHNLLKGNYDAAKDWLRGLGVYTDKIDVSAQIERIEDDQLVSGLRSLLVSAKNRVGVGYPQISEKTD